MNAGTAEIENAPETPRARKKPGKPSFFQRMANRGREAKTLGQTLVHEPRRFPGQLLALVRRSVRTIWDARGGGFYACGFVVTFIWLEFRLLLDDIVSAESVGDFFGEQLFEMFFRFLSESFINSFRALIWPVYFIEDGRPGGLILLLALYLAFRYLFKAPLERWLFDDPAADKPDRKQESTTS